MRNILALLLSMAGLGSLFAQTSFAPSALQTVPLLPPPHANREINTFRPLNGPVVYPTFHPRKENVLNKSVSTYNISATVLGESVNPFTVLNTESNYLYANPMLKSVALIRRGGPNDFAGCDSEPRNKLWVDINNQNGKENKWQVGKWMIFNNCYYPDPSLALPRYPQGVIQSTAANTDTNNARIVAVASTLDGSNGSWGGLARAGISMQTGSQPWQANTTSSPAATHFLTRGMTTTKDGRIFFVEPEIDQNTSPSTFLGNVLIYRLTYNPALQIYDTLMVVRSFGATSISNSSISFADDGQKGFVVVLAYSPLSNAIPGVSSLFVSQTNDGGITWSPFSFVDFNTTNPGGGIPDDFRNALLGDSIGMDPVTGNFITTGPQHKIIYTGLGSCNSSVDSQGQLHVFANVGIGGIEDILPLTDFDWRPSLGTWQVDVVFKTSTDMRAIVLGKTTSFNGIYGDYSGPDILLTDNRSKISRSWDGNYLSFNWTTTDTTIHPYVDPFKTNVSPDIWTRSLKVNPGDFNIEVDYRGRNLTHGSNLEGMAHFANFSPYMIEEGGKLYTPAVTALLSDFQGATHPWPITHLYVSGLEVNQDSLISRSLSPLAYRIILANQEKTSREPLVMHPNPAQDLVHFSTQVMELVVCDVLGKEVMRQKTGTEPLRTLDVGPLQEGLYVVKTYDQSGKERIGKLLIKR